MKKILAILCIVPLLTGIVHTPEISAGTVSNAVVTNCAYAYTYKNDPNQTTQKYNYNYNVRLGSNYVIGSPADIERGLYTKFDISSYIEQGYTIQKAEYVMKFAKATFNLKLALLDCPDNVIQTGVTNYLTAPSTAGQPIVTVSTYGDVPLSGYTGIPSDWNFAGDITAYVNNKVEAGQYSFTITPIYWYVGTLCINELPMLYLTLVKNVPPTVNIISSEEGALIDIDKPYELRATATDTDGNITKVDFYVNSNLIGTSDTAVMDTYSVSLPPNTIPRGPCLLKAIATDDNGMVSAASTRNIIGKSDNVTTKTDLIPTTDAANIKIGDPNQTWYDQYTNFWISGKSDGTPDRALVLKYDLTDYESKDIQKIEIIYKGPYQSAAGYIKFHEVSRNDWQSRINYLDVPPYNATPFATKPIAITPDTYLLSNDGYNINDGVQYNAAVDITEFAMQKINSKQSVFSVFMTLSNSGSFCMKLPKLYITYKDNYKPTAVITLPAVNIQPSNAEMIFSAEIKDIDGTINTTQFKFDNICFDSATKTNDIYSVTIPAESMTEGKHTLEVTAVDNNGACCIAAKIINVRSYSINSRVISNGLGGAPVFKAGATISNDISVSNHGLDNMQITAVIALYDKDNQLKKFNYTTKILASGETKNISASIIIPMPSKNDSFELSKCTVKAYVWDNMENFDFMDEPHIYSAR